MYMDIFTRPLCPNILKSIFFRTTLFNYNLINTMYSIDRRVVLLKIN